MSMSLQGRKAPDDWSSLFVRKRQNPHINGYSLEP